MESDELKKQLLSNAGKIVSSIMKGNSVEIKKDIDNNLVIYETKKKKLSGIIKKDTFR